MLAANLTVLFSSKSLFFPKVNPFLKIVIKYMQLLFRTLDSISFVHPWRGRLKYRPGGGQGRQCKGLKIQVPGGGVEVTCGLGRPGRAGAGPWDSRSPGVGRLLLP